MKFRTDFVTNSSSANYTVEIDFESKSGIVKKILATDKGYGFYLNLSPISKGNDVLFSGKSIFAIDNFSDLRQLIIDSIDHERPDPDEEFDDYDEDDEDDDDDFDDEDDDKSIYDLVITESGNNVPIKHLTKITVKDSISGSGESAKWVDWNECKSEVIESFQKQYAEASNSDEKETIIKKMFDYIKSSPKLTVFDNEYIVEVAVCVWNVGDDVLKSAIETFLGGKRSAGKWMGEFSREYIIDMVPKSLGNDTLILKKGIICDKCNNYFALNIEKPFLEIQAIKLLRSYHLIESRKKRVPPLNVLFCGDEATMQFDKKSKSMIIEVSPETAYKLIKGSYPSYFFSHTINIKELENNYNIICSSLFVLTISL